MSKQASRSVYAQSLRAFISCVLIACDAVRSIAFSAALKLPFFCAQRGVRHRRAMCCHARSEHTSYVRKYL